MTSYLYDTLSRAGGKVGSALDEGAFQAIDSGLDWITGFSDSVNGWFGAHLNEIELTHMPTTPSEVRALQRARDVVREP